MKRTIFAMLALCCAVIFGSDAYAREWTIVGPRALGMGGANVAVANDATAGYWNPAAYGFFKGTDGGDYGKRTFSAVLDAGVGAQIHEDLGEQINKIKETNFNNVNSGQISAVYVGDFLKLTTELKTFNDNPNRAITVMMNAGLRGQYSHYGIGAYGYGDISARGYLDLVNIAPVSSSGLPVNLISAFSTTSNFNNGTPAPAGNYFTSAQKTSLVNTISALPGWDATSAANFVQAADYGLTQAQANNIAIPDVSTNINNVTTVATLASSAQTGGSFANNNSALIIKGLTVVEVPLTYGYALTEDFSVGGNIKYMRGTTYHAAIPVFNKKINTALNDAKHMSTDSSAFGLDLGLLYRFGDKVRLALVGRNLNSPSFDMKKLSSTYSLVEGANEDTIKEKAQVRAGMAFKPLDFITFALDYDITDNDTTISKTYKSRNLCGGVELNLLKIIQLRVGAYKNMSKRDIGPVYTGGLGLNLWLVNIDLGASVSPKTVKIDTTTLPKEVKAELAISTLF